MKLSLIDFQAIILEILRNSESSPQHTVIIDPKSMSEAIIFPVAHYHLTQKLAALRRAAPTNPWESVSAVISLPSS